MITNNTELKNKKKETEKLKSITTSMNIHALMRLDKCIKSIKLAEENQKYNNEVAQAFYNNPKTSIYNIAKKINNQSGKNLLIVISSNKGFCGEYNNKLQNKLDQKKEDYEILLFGNKVINKKNKDLFDNNLNLHNIGIEDVLNDQELIRKLANLILENLFKGKYKTISIMYNHYENATTYYVNTKTLFPFDKSKDDNDNKKDYKSYSDYEMNLDDPDLFLFNMTKQILTNSIHACLINSYTTEVLQRVAITSGAKDKLEEKEIELKINGFKLRAMNITNETNDINNAVLLKRKRNNE